MLFRSAKVTFCSVVEAEARSEATETVPVSVGEAENTTTPVPVSSESHEENCAEVEKSEEVAIKEYPPVLFPCSIWNWVGAVLNPVPPYTTESVLEPMMVPFAFVVRI